MPNATLPQVLKRLRERPPAAAVYLHGDEEHLREEALAQLIDAVLDPATRDFNLDQLRGADVAPEALASLVATPPMMAQYRVVVVRDAQQLSPKGRDALEQAVEQVPAGLMLFIAASEPAGSKAKFYRNLKSATAAIEFSPIDAHDLPGWLIERAETAHAKALEPDAARALGAACGTDLGLLTSELAKLASYADERPAITLDDVRAVGGYVPRADRWAWFDLIGERRWDEALRQLPVLLESGENGVGLIIGMGSHLLRVALAVAGGREALERELKPYQRWLARRIAPQARGWTLGEVDAALGELLRTDRLLKTTALSDRAAIEELLLRLAAIEPAERAA